MFPVLLALGFVGGLVTFAVRETVSPTIKPEFERRKFEKLLNKDIKTLTLKEAEDGMVLSRRYHNTSTFKQFAQRAIVLRKTRIPI